MFYMMNSCLCCYHRFPCGRWLGKDIEDGSTERLLIAVPYDTGFRGSDGPATSTDGSSNGSPTQSSLGSSAGSRTRSPSATRENSLTNSLTNLAGNLNINLKSGMRAKKLTETEIQCLLGIIV